jgi:DNA repair exonuclease SbcCD ATPase subunit
MRDATQSLQKSDPQGAAQPQKQAAESLEQALQQVKDARQAAGQNEQQKDPGAQQQQMKQLADEQQKIEEQLRDLMQRMKDQQQKGQEQADAASRSMDRAKQQLDEQDGEQAQQSEREAEKNLQDLEKKLDEEETRYQNLRSEEILFRLKEKLGDARKRAQALHDGIAQVDADRAGAESLPRRLRPKVQQFADDAAALKKDNDDIHDRVAKEGSPSFPWVLEKNSGDLTEINTRLAGREKETGAFVQILASDVVGRYDRLLQAFDDELKRRQQSKQDPNQGGKPPQQGGKPPLVPPVAELLLLKHLEEDVLQDVQTFRASADEVTDKDLDDARMKLLERLGHRHTELTNIFDALVKQQTDPGPAPDGEDGKPKDGEKDGEKPKDDKKPKDEGDKR